MPGGDAPAVEPGDVAERGELGSCFLQFQGELVDGADERGDVGAELGEFPVLVGDRLPERLEHPVAPDRAPARPAGGIGDPRREGDEIAVDIATRAGLVTVIFTSAASASARPAGTAFGYRAGATPAACTWRGRPGAAAPAPGCRCSQRAAPLGRASPLRIADVIGAAVAAWLGDHPGVLDLAAQAAAAAARARPQRELELLQPEIAAAGQQLEELRRKQHRLRVIAAGGSGSPPDPPAAMGQEGLYGAVAGVPVDVEVAGGNLVITVWRYDPAAVGQFTIDARSGAAAVVAAVAGEDGGTGRARPGAHTSTSTRTRLQAARRKETRSHERLPRRPSGTWQVTGPGQRTIAYVAGQSYPGTSPGAAQTAPHPCLEVCRDRQAIARFRVRQGGAVTP